MINEQWVKEFEDLCIRFESNNASIKEFTDDHLHFLIYWNFGYTEPFNAPETIAAKDELTRRGITYNNNRAEELNDLIKVIG